MQNDIEQIPLGKAKDLTNQRFGKLTALYRVKSEYKGAYWLCKCDCGNEKIIRGSHLISGNVKSCNQCNYENLLNQRFGRLTVIKDAHKKSLYGHAIWTCQCDCGNIIDVSSTNLKSGNTQSCGCYQKDQCKIKNSLNISIGKRYGLLTIIKEVDSNKKGIRCFQCKCDCGNTIVVDIRALQSGQRKTCGCTTSIGQAKIIKLLNNANINFEIEKVFSNFRYPDTKGIPRFDFFINNHYLIEYDGNIHFEDQIVENGWNTEDEYKKRIKHDKIKNQWCKKNNIPLIRIPYTHLNNLCIEDLQLETTQFRVI